MECLSHSNNRLLASRLQAEGAFWRYRARVRDGGDHAGEPPDVVAVQVRDENLVNGGRLERRVHHLVLRALAAVDHPRLVQHAQHNASHVATVGWRSRRRALLQTKPSPMPHPAPAPCCFSTFASSCCSCNAATLPIMKRTQDRGRRLPARFSAGCMPSRSDMTQPEKA